MKPQKLILLTVALCCGLVAMLGVQQILANNQGGGVKTHKVLVALTDITPGLQLDDSMVAFREWPEGAIPEGSITDASEYENRSVKVKVFAGEMLLKAKLGEKGVFGVGANIPPGMRVVSVPVDMTVTNSGMIRPGDRIDVLLTFKSQAPGMTTSRTKTVLEYLEVFAVDRNRDPDNTDGNKGAKIENLSLLVTPTQANLLMLAQSKGKLQMALRNALDTNDGAASVVTDDDLEGRKTEKGLARKEPDEFADNTGDLRSFLEKAEEVEKSASDSEAKDESTSSTEAESPSSEAARPPETRTNVWVIEIYEGDTKRTEEIQLKTDTPSSATATKPPAKSAVKPSTKAKTTSL